LDDLHWTDVSTIDLLAYLGTKIDSMRLLVVATYRSEELFLAKHPFLPVKLDLQGRGLCREIPLDFLSREDLGKYLALEFPEHRFPETLPDLIHARTEGSPLFMVDLLRYLRDRGVIAEEQGRWAPTQSISEIERELPQSLRGVIERKIGRLSEVDRRLLVAASVQGQEFDSAVVARTLGMDAAEVEERLEELDRVHALVRLAGEREFPDKTFSLRYRFVHVLYQNALYASLTATRKASLSSGVAQALLSFYGEQSGTIAGALALLLEVARDFERASDYFLLAAQNAARLFAHRETVALARRGLELLETQPDTPGRAQKELLLQTTLGPALTVTRGLGAPEVGRTYARAQELCQQVGDAPEVFPVIFGLFAFYQERAELQTARRLGEQLLPLAESSHDSSLLVMAHRALLDVLMFLGEYVPALEHIERCREIYDPEAHRSLYVLYGHDPGVLCLLYRSWILDSLGFREQGLKASQESLALAKHLSHPFSLTLAVVGAAMLHGFRREPRLARERAEQGIELCTEHGFPQILAFATIRRGHALSGLEEAEEGVIHIRHGIADWRATGAEVAIPFWLASLAEALGEAGQIEEGLSALREALEAIQRTGERWYEAECLRLKGQLLLEQATPVEEEAEACFRQAIDVARRQQSKTFELRATMSLSQLLEKRGKKEEAREILAEIYNLFTEGFDTADLQEAQALLGEWSSP
jgi:predicted ATPase